jgi:DNA-directed RNA polymerase specialized sigma24 family protein
MLSAQRMNGAAQNDAGTENMPETSEAFPRVNVRSTDAFSVADEQDEPEAPHRPFLLDLIDDDRLTSEQRTYLRLRYQEDRTEDEVQQLLAMTPEQIHNFEQMTFRHIRALRDPVMEGAFDDDTE